MQMREKFFIKNKLKFIKFLNFYSSEYHLIIVQFIIHVISKKKNLIFYLIVNKGIILHIKTF